MDDPDWDEELTADVLAERYGVTAETVERVSMDTDTITRRVVTSDGHRLSVKEYLSTADLDAARSAWDMSEFCRAADLPVPRAWPGRDGDLVVLAEGSAWAVVDESPGRVATSAMSVARAEHIGMVLGRMHRVLAAYPLPRRVQPSRWRTQSVQDAVTKCSRVLSLARRQGHGDLAQLHDQLDQRRQDLRSHVGRLQAGLPEDLVEQALHADFTRPNMLVLTDVVTGIVGFRGAKAFPVWELGRAALDPRTVATSDLWPACATAMVSAYRSENPTLRLADVLACFRVALLYLLF
ncbi:hypothetical protein GCM10022403_079160 [Streptomyces coacervatus]|uniref:Aminoglycoside phosphotransferase domain-containing protein n=1 Tax=Streptomyces coacervatus TaxID=647381 RepID=A0ABP7J536_9ACTN|nr:phosphotransferase [Streptomyces coacervatus]MDF2269309.1 phosphotransferase [Streptomyces coacervatus]